jgi:hypothetical protein
MVSCLKSLKLLVMHFRYKPDSVPIKGPYHLSSPNLTVRVYLPTPRAANS